MSISLSSLTQWSHEHIAKIFTSTNDEDCLQALRDTFSRDVRAKLNDIQIGFDDIKRSVMILRRESVGHGGLRIHWEHGVEAPHDFTNRVSLPTCFRLERLTSILLCKVRFIWRHVRYSRHTQDVSRTIFPE